MKILVTGGAGYIGSQTCKQLSELNHELLVFDNLSTGFIDNVQWSEFIKGDLLDKKLLNDSIKKFKPDSVMHFAAKAYVGESNENPMAYFATNVSGSINLFESLIENKVKHVVFSSTCATYGQPTKTPISESVNQNPINPYGQSKLLVENILKTISKVHDLSFVAFRYFNAAGADPESGLIEKHDPETHLIPLAVKSALENFELDVYGSDFDTSDGSAIRDFVHVKDLAKAHILGLERINNDSKNEFFNLGSGAGVSVFEVLNTLKSMGYSPKFSIKSKREGDPAVLIADATKAKTILGWNPINSNIKEILTSVLDATTKSHSN